MNTHARAALLILLCTTATAQVGFAQGSLTPPGAPAPTMKTLDQLDAKLDQAKASVGSTATKVEQLDAKLEKRTPISSLPYTISEPGSYYLTGNLQFSAATGNAITVSASDVTLDLMGFTLSSTAEVTGDGIQLAPGVRNVAVRNGQIAGQTTVTENGNTWTATAAGFANGVNAVNAAPRVTGCEFTGLRIAGCRTTGLRAGYGAVIGQVVVTQNGGIGMVATYSTITNSSAYLNRSTGFTVSLSAISDSIATDNGSAGISMASGTVTNCKASGNGSDGISAETSNVTGSTAHTNAGNGIDAAAGTVTTSNSSSNGGVGIIAQLVSDCIASANFSHGIRVFPQGVAKDNAASSNGNGGNGAGIHFSGDGARIEGNNCTNNDWGIQSAAASNGFVVRNSCRNNSTAPTNAGASSNYDFDRATNTYGPVVVVASGDISSSAAAGAAHPTANYQY